MTRVIIGSPGTTIEGMYVSMAKALDAARDEARAQKRRGKNTHRYHVRPIRNLDGQVVRWAVLRRKA